MKDVASLTEKGTSRTLASVRASSVLPTRGEAYSSINNVIYTPEPVGPLAGDTHEWFIKSLSDLHTSPKYYSSQMSACVGEKKRACLDGVCEADGHGL